jgi:predicted lysophospholipase L1 biosynthesis ABC-type transport system permease subunit
VILVNETFARRYFGDEDPIGQSTNRGTIVGLVGDIRNMNLDQPSLPELYYPVAQNWSQVTDLGMSLVVRTDGPPIRIIDRVRAVVREVDPDEAVFSIKTMDAVVADSMAGFSVFLSLMVSFAVLAIALALTGTYGLVSYVATSRVREFAIRAALGADRISVIGLVLAQGAGVTAIGLAIGIGSALLAAPLLKGLPVSVRGPDLLTIGPVAVLIGLTTLAACLVPARRAANADPMSLLRSE